MVDAYKSKNLYMAEGTRLEHGLDKCFCADMKEQLPLEVSCQKSVGTIRFSFDGGAKHLIQDACFEIPALRKQLQATDRQVHSTIHVFTVFVFT